ncbi:MAG: hypothetical protein RIB59_05280 [Rhodospirillales bacterium]
MAEADMTAEGTAYESGADAGEDWRSGIEDAQVRRFAGRFQSPADAARTAFELRQKLSTALPLPGKDAGEDEVARFREHLGVPPEPDGYGIALHEIAPKDFPVSEDDQMRLQSFLETMHKAGAPQDVVKAAVGFYYEMASDALGEMQAGRTESLEAANAELHKEWGRAYEGNIKAAQRALVAYGGDRLIEFLNNTQADGMRLGDHPEIIRAFASIGKAVGEDGFHGGEGAAAGSTVQERINEIHAWQYSPDPAVREKYRSAAAQNELESLYARLHGEGPVVGSAGRAT